jgi:hypothetical protein
MRAFVVTDITILEVPSSSNTAILFKDKNSFVRPDIAACIDYPFERQIIELTTLHYPKENIHCRIGFAYNVDKKLFPFGAIITENNALRSKIGKLESAVFYLNCINEVKNKLLKRFYGAKLSQRLKYLFTCKI